MREDEFVDILQDCMKTISSNLPSGWGHFDFESKIYASVIYDDICNVQKICRKSSLILDLGCGRGALSAILSKIGFSPIGLELPLSEWWHGTPTKGIPESFLSNSSQGRIWRDLSKLSGANYLFFGGTELPIKDETVDMVLAYAVIEHVNPSVLDRWMSEIARVLKSSG